jgi:LysM repeat protein
MSLRARLSLCLIFIVALSYPSAFTKAEDSTVIHVVQPGDTLLKLELFYGRGFHELAALNELQAPYEIATGRELAIPVAFEVETDEEIAAEDEAQPTYVVQRGDTLFRIATRFSVPMDALAAANNIVWVDRIYVGQVLTIPGDDYVIPPDYSAAVEEALTPNPFPTYNSRWETDYCCAVAAACFRV